MAKQRVASKVVPLNDLIFKNSMSDFLSVHAKCVRYPSLAEKTTLPKALDEAGSDAGEMCAAQARPFVIFFGVIGLFFVKGENRLRGRNWGCHRRCLPLQAIHAERGLRSSLPIFFAGGISLYDGMSLGQEGKALSLGYRRSLSARLV